MKPLAAVVAWDLNRGIGLKGGLPWIKLPADRKFFRDLTINQTVLMGFVTAESLEDPYRPLPNRRNIVRSRDGVYDSPGFEAISSPDELTSITAPEEQVYVIGGAKLYAAMLPKIEILYVTEVHDVFPVDTYFPAFNEAEWKVSEKTERPADEKNLFDLVFTTYKRIRSDD